MLFIDVRSFTFINNSDLSIIGVRNIFFSISQLMDMLWVLKRNVSARRFFWTPKTNVKSDGLRRYS